MGKGRKNAGPRYPKELTEQLRMNKPFKDKMVLKEVLGSGALSTVRRAVDRKNKDLVFAAKIEQKLALTSDMRRAEFFAREIDALTSLSHPHIVQWHGIQENDRDLVLITEFAPCGDLAAAGALVPTECTAVASQVMQALSYMHAQDFIHGDIKPENVLLAQREPMSIRLTDFGTAARFGSPASACGVACCDGDGVAPCSLRGRRGTIGYMAPEVLFEDSCCAASDIWSSTIMFKGLPLGKQPFDTPDCGFKQQGHEAMRPIVDSLCARDAPSFMSQNLPSLASVLPPSLGGNTTQLCADSELELAVFRMDPAERPCAVAILARPDWLLFGSEPSKESLDESLFKKTKLEITKKLRSGQDLTTEEEAFCSEHDL